MLTLDEESEVDAGVGCGGSIMKMILRRIRHYVFTCSNTSYRKLLFSRLFDSRYYLASNPDLKARRWDLMWHYFDHGWRERRRPSLFFDSHCYCRKYLDGAEEQVNPLVDYLETGWREGKNPNNYFDSNFYIERYGRAIKGNINPLTHYLKIGWKRDFLPSPLFLERKFERKYFYLRSKGFNPISYFLEQEDQKRNSPPDYFDADCYHDRHPFLPKQKKLLWQHYIVRGLPDGKSPLPVFDSRYYQEQNPDCKKSLSEPFQHYQKKEKLDYRRPSPFFDPEFYRAAICRRQEQHKSLLEHYLKKGVFEFKYTDQRVADLECKPLISIILPVYNPTQEQLNLCIRSVLYQAYPHWQLCICDDRSTEEHVQQTLVDWARLDGRITVVCHLKNRGIAETTNTAASMASGDYIGFLDNDDELRRDCLYHVVKAISNTGGDVLYTDENLVNESGDHLSAFYKPGYNRELLLGHNYITHFLVIQRGLFELCGGCDKAMDGAQDFDLALKVTEQAKLVVHIPEVVYHWRVSDTSTNINHCQKPYAAEAGKLAVQRAFLRSGIEAKVEHADWNFYYQPRRKLVATPSVSIILYPEDGVQHPEDRLATLDQITDGYDNAELLFTSGACNSRLGEQYLKIEAESDRCTYLPNHDSPGKAELLNRAAKQASGKYLIFLSSNVAPKDTNWIQQLLEYGQNEEIGLVTGRLESAESMLDISRVPDVRSESVLYYWWFLLNCSIHLNGLNLAQEVTAVPFEMCLVRKEVFERAGGFSAASFPYLFMGMDLSFILRSKGLINIYTPYCRALWDYQPLLQLEQKMQVAWQREQKIFQKLWGEMLYQGDPYYHPGCYREEGISDEDFSAWCTGVSEK